ncbi:cytochrome P450 [Colletotrichum graminicola]|uniref:Cytochrome P450 n=1 Tax=Colletotrichum graminicola (strain M1.001 / M2 / FGSC 10212) TaxID=645133 RepID=E3Q2K9_COLGM|nr:cytochrome P450 [Colletotrichum graminicola M1.001]EFQ25310.1 cytochrome P450 [Colletotrichum graminicola M1.001]WDK15023.1 cytochrome P450 [Colletotrichum graminicola]
MAAFDFLWPITGLAPSTMAVSIPLFLGAALVVIFILSLVYNLYFHPLRRYPGPRSWGATRLMYSWELVHGRAHKSVLALHKQYGDIVRIAPDELSVCSPAMWREVWGRRKTELGEIPKDDIHYAEALTSILGCPKKQHTRFRRILAPGFTGTAVAEQSPFIKKHVDNFFRVLHSHVAARGQQAIDISEWFDFAMADIASDLSFGDSFDCLNTGKYHPWTQLFNEAHTGHAYAKATQRFPLVTPLFKLVAKNSPLQKRWDANVNSTRRLVDRRLLEADRPDFVRALASHGNSDEKEPLTRDEIQWNAQILMSAAYDTTAVGLTTATYLLAKHPEWAQKVADEMRAAFASDNDIVGLATLELKVLNAAIDEALRLLPPAGSAMPRVVPAPGENVFGEFMPGGTILTMWMWSTYRNPANFKNPDEFHPERWLGDKEYDGDRKDVFMPFSFGMRACIGRQLARAELGILIGRLLWNFHLEVDPSEREDWIDQPNLLLWQKGTLMVNLTSR